MFDWKRVLITALIGASFLAAAEEKDEKTSDLPAAERSHHDAGHEGGD